MSKQKASKLDQFAETLLEMDDQTKTIAEMQTWLKEEGVSVSTGRISVFLASLRQERLQAQLLSQITSGARQAEQVEKQFKKDAPPELETLIKLHRVLVLQLSTQGAADPESMKLADQLARTAMEFASAQTKAGLEKQKLSIAERRVSLLEKKAAAFDQAKGILENRELTEAQREARMKEVFGL